MLIGAFSGECQCFCSGFGGYTAESVRRFAQGALTAVIARRRGMAFRHTNPPRLFHPRPYSRMRPWLTLMSASRETRAKTLSGT